MQTNFQATDRLAQLIEEKHSVLQQLREKSRQQADLIRGQEMDRLMSVLAAKQILVGELQKVESALDPYREEEPDDRTWRSEEHRARTRRAAEQCDELLKESLLLDKQSESMLRHHRDDAATKLRSINDAGQASRAYGMKPQERGGGQLDISS